MTNELPPLPEPAGDIIKHGCQDGLAWVRLGFTVDQMRAHALAAIAAEREACAKVCEAQRSKYPDHSYNEGVGECAEAIRARATGL